MAGEVPDAYAALLQIAKEPDTDERTEKLYKWNTTRCVHRSDDGGEFAAGKRLPLIYWKPSQRGFQGIAVLKYAEIVGTTKRVQVTAMPARFEEGRVWNHVSWSRHKRSEQHQEYSFIVSGSGNGSAATLTDAERKNHEEVIRNTTHANVGGFLRKSTSVYIGYWKMGERPQEPFPNYDVLGIFKEYEKKNTVMVVQTMMRGGIPVRGEVRVPLWAHDRVWKLSGRSDDREELAKSAQFAEMTKSFERLSGFLLNPVYDNVTRKEGPVDGQSKSITKITGVKLIEGGNGELYVKIAAKVFLPMDFTVSALESGSVSETLLELSRKKYVYSFDEGSFNLQKDMAKRGLLENVDAYEKYADELDRRHTRILGLTAGKEGEEEEGGEPEEEGGKPEEEGEIQTLETKIKNLEEELATTKTQNVQLRKTVMDTALTNAELRQELAQVRKQLERRPGPAPTPTPAPAPALAPSPISPVPVGKSEIQTRIDAELNKLNDLTRRARDATGEAANDLRRKKRDVAREIEKLNAQLVETAQKRPAPNFDAFIFKHIPEEPNPDPLTGNDTGLAFQKRFQLEMAKPLLIEFSSLEGRTYARASVQSAKPNVFQENDTTNYGSYVIRFDDTELGPMTHRPDEYVDGWGFEALATFPTQGRVTMRVGNLETGGRYDLSGEKAVDLFLKVDLFNQSDGKKTSFTGKKAKEGVTLLHTTGTLRVHLQESEAGSTAYRVLFVEALHEWKLTQ